MYECRDDIAVIGMSCRFPMANSIQEFWDNLKEGKDCISRKNNENQGFYISAYGKLNKVNYFDYDFFGKTEKEAQQMDPQQRFLFTIVSEAMENAGYVVKESDVVGLFSGADEFKYVWEGMLCNEKYSELDYYMGRFNLSGSLTSRISYYFDFRGPSITSKASCATALFSTHLACQSLLNYECNVAIAGGVSIYNAVGYYKAEGTMSSDGFTRCFDKNASGFVPADGAGVLVLKRLSDSIKDHDHIYAIIRGSAINNDGNRKAGYSAPSVMGEVRAIYEAQQISEIEPNQVSYIETHGTATDLGDAIEIESLKKVFLNDSIVRDQRKNCAIGAVKSNIGHTSIAAGAAGLIKTILMLQNKYIVPTINYSNPNEKLNLKDSPFYIANKYEYWENNNNYRIAGVSSFGIGGMNCHVVLHETPDELLSNTNGTDEEKIFLLSAKTEKAIYEQMNLLADHIENNENVNLDNVAYTLQTGRYRYNFRKSLLANNKDELIFKLRNAKKISQTQSTETPKIAFMFPGSSHVDYKMLLELYESNTEFKTVLTDCFKCIDRNLDIDVYSYIKSEVRIAETDDILLMPLIFSTNYALAKVWINIGIYPDYVIGYSLGEYVAACISEIMTLDDALYVVIERGKLFSKVEDGKILSVMASESQIKPILFDGIEISSYNAKERIMVAGKNEHIENFEKKLKENNVSFIDVGVVKPGHCAEVECILDDIKEIFSHISLRKPCIPFVSSSTGQIILENDITNPDYWIKQTRNAVRFRDALSNFHREEPIIALEIGSSNQLQMMAKKNSDFINAEYVFGSYYDNLSFEKSILLTCGKLWERGIEFNWDNFYKDKPYKTPLPNYPFQYKKIPNMNKKGTIKFSNEEEYTLVVDGLSDERWALTEYIVRERGNNIILLEKKAEELPALSTSISQQLIEIQKIEEYMVSKSKLKCIWEVPGLIEAYDKLCLSSASDLFKEFNLFLSDDKETYTFNEIYIKTGVIEKYKPLLNKLIFLLSKAGYLKLDIDKIELVRTIKYIDNLDETLKREISNFSQYKYYMELLNHCSRQYKNIISGIIEGKEVLYPDGSYELVMGTEDNLPVSSKIDLYCDIVAKIIQHLMKYQKRRVKILEFGAGTGIVTWKVVEALKNFDVEYYFTDIGRSFIANAEKHSEIHKYKNVKFKKFDITKSYKSQGFSSGEFDIIISCNVIQAMENMSEVLTNITGMLKKSGLLCLLQTVCGHDIQEMIFGLCPEWWNYCKDPLRVDKPIMSYDKWIDFLSKHNFKNIQILPDLKSENKSDLGLIIAENDNENVSTHSLKEKERLDIILNQFPELKIIYYSDNDLGLLQESIDKLRAEYNISEIIQPKIENEIKELVYRNETDRILIEILKDVIGSTPTDLSDNIFELDVDSLSGMLISGHIRNTFQIDFTIKDLLSVDTIGKLSDLISDLVNTQIDKVEDVMVKNKIETKDINELINSL